MARSHSSSSSSSSPSARAGRRDAAGLIVPRRQRAQLLAGSAADSGSGGTARPARPVSRAWRDDTGAATAEYAIATMAAVGFASLLVVILRSDEVRGILTGLVRTALTVGG